MTQCQTCQSQLLHHLYGVLDEAETTALVAHLGDCPDCQAALDKARGQQHLLAAAARAEFPNVRFEPIPAEAKPQITRVASSPRRFAPRRWAIAASILVLVGGPALWVATMWVNGNSGAKSSPMAMASLREKALAEEGEGARGEFAEKRAAADGKDDKGPRPPISMLPLSELGGIVIRADSGPGKPGDIGTGGAGGAGKGAIGGAGTGGAIGGAGMGGAAGGGGKGGGGGFGGGGAAEKKGTIDDAKIDATLKFIPITNIDPAVVQRALDAINGKTPPVPPVATDGARDKDKDAGVKGTDAAKAKGDKGDVVDGKRPADELNKVLKELLPDTKVKILDADKLKAAARDHKGEPGAGQLTAGSFDDTRHASSFKRFLQTLSQNSFVGGIPNQFKGRHVTITVKDSSGMPVDNARVEISSGNTSIKLLSRTDGRVIVVTPWDPLPDNAHWTVTVTPPVGEGGKAVTTECTQPMDKLDVVLPESRHMATRVLDLALVIDCTGSMGDELEYIKSEMKWIASSIKEKYPEVKQRYALIVYRDKGDEYVTRPFQFTDSIDKLLDNIKAQRSGGGGDMPEAVEKAMDEAMQLQWSTGRAARMLIHVADAPPHTQDFEYSLKAVDRIRKAGIAFYPVACSGYDPPCELHMRISSLLTGGHFLFLTDDSGIGNSHAEPHVHDYHVERLAPLLVRMISSEIAGHQIEVNPQDIIRTVGNPAKAAAK